MKSAVVINKIYSNSDMGMETVPEVKREKLVQAWKYHWRLRGIRVKISGTAVMETLSQKSINCNECVTGTDMMVAE